MSEDVRDPADMEAVGNALMDAIEKDYASHAFMKGWHPADCPSEIVGDLLNALDETLSTPAPADASGPFEFERYVNGVKMAQGITIERETALQAAMRRAVELCPKYQGTVLVLAPPATTTPPRPNQSKWRKER